MAVMAFCSVSFIHLFSVIVADNNCLRHCVESEEKKRYQNYSELRLKGRRERETDRQRQTDRQTDRKLELSSLFY